MSRNCALLFVFGLSLISQPGWAGETHNVLISLFQFKPAAVKVKKGDVVRWTNKDAIPHSATASGVSPHFDTGLFEKGQTRGYRFLEAGRFPYICTRHPSMKAIVIVE